MKERPILLNTDMVQAVIDGRKTQTRRPVKNQPKNGWAFEDADKGGTFGRIKSSHPKKGKFGAFIRRGVGTDFPEVDIEVCPFGMPGDRLWVRETFCPVNDEGNQWMDYRATPSDCASHPAGWHNAPDDPEALKWKPSIHMPRWACRLVLEITDVRIERVQEITKEDAQAEGCSGRSEFRDLWMSIYEHAWDSLYSVRQEYDDWVWVIDFKIVELNGKKMEQAA